LQVIIYVLTRPGRELLFTAVPQDEKYKAKVKRCFLEPSKTLIIGNKRVMSWYLKK
jgi:hypothetical protein